MERPPESLKAFANRIARSAVSDHASEIVNLLNVSGFFGDRTNAAGEPRGAVSVADLDDALGAVPPTSYGDNVGIWGRKVINGKVTFVRRLEAMDEWHFWADVGRIDAKSEKLRVLFEGESVARGFLYDPGFTPAFALQTILEEQFGTEQVEVIDLARTNLGYELKEVAHAALQLEPDIAIIFAGNNWGFAQPTFANIGEIDKAMATEGMAGVKRVCDEYIARTVRSMVSEIALEYQTSGIPLIWIIPESNLANWREPFTNAPYLPENRNREWITVVKEGWKALSDGDTAAAEKLAARVVELDEGTCAAGYYILADCCRLANDADGQRKYLELARDAQSWDVAIMFTPKPYALSQQILREELLKCGAQIVDLPALFKEYLNGEVPGNRIFLDYCHLTTEGIQVAMGAAASGVLRALKGIEQPWHTLIRDHIAPSPEIEAEALFLAAIHDAHHYQSYEMVHHFCARAVKHSPHVAELMLKFIDLQVQDKAPLHMSETDSQILRLGSPLIHRYLSRRNDKRLDKVLLTAIADALEEIGIPARERLERLYREEHSTRFAETNLLDSYYYQSAGQPHELAALASDSFRADGEPRYYRAYWPESKFVFIGEAGYAVNLSLTCRLPSRSLAEAKISVECNGKPQVEITVSKEWSSWEITVPAEVVRDGVNEIEVRWPIPEFRTDEVLSEGVLKLCRQMYPEYYPIFGEIHSFTASVGRQVSTTSPVVPLKSSLIEVS
jgi:hypothetical protein